MPAGEQLVRALAARGAAVIGWRGRRGARAVRGCVCAVGRGWDAASSCRSQATLRIRCGIHEAVICGSSARPEFLLHLGGAVLTF
jgi:hypothetical protein